MKYNEDFDILSDSTGSKNDTTCSSCDSSDSNNDFDYHLWLIGVDLS